MRAALAIIWLLLITTVASASGSDAQTGTTGPSPANPQFHVVPADEGWLNSLPRAAEAATQAYLNRLPADVLQRSNNYFEGGYWLQLWNFLLGLVIAVILLGQRRSAIIRDWAQRVGRYAFIRDGLYALAYSIASWLLSLPLTIYQNFIREHAYGMANQHFGAWFGEELLGLLVNSSIFAIVIAILYAAIRRIGDRWWLWGTGIVTTFLIFEFLVFPIWVDPLFNTYKPLDEGAAKTAVLSMAKANAVPVDNVYWYDASRQTTRVSANVSGIFGSAAIRLNDNLLFHSSLPEIRAVTAHEIGHYVLHHLYISILEFGLMTLAGFLFAKWAMQRLLQRYAQRFSLQGISDVANLPLLMAVFSVCSFVATPISNTLSRIQEIEADRFGLNLAREPLGAAEVYLKLTEYRKPDPGAIEEFVFFDHPSTRFRIKQAMRWRENLDAH